MRKKHIIMSVILSVLLIMILSAFSASSLFAKNQYRHKEVDAIFDMELYITNDDKVREANWTVEGLWDLYKRAKEVDPNEEYYRTHYIHLLYLDRTYEDKEGLRQCIIAASNVVHKVKDFHALKQNHIYRYWPEDKTTFLKGIRQQEVFYAYWDIVNYYLGLNDYDISKQYLDDFTIAGNRIYRFQGNILGFWHEFSGCESPDDYWILLRRVRKYAIKMKRESSSIYDDWWYRRQKNLLYLMTKNIEGGILSELLESKASIKVYKDILNEIRRVKRYEGYDLFDNAYIENLAMTYFEDFNFDAVNDLYSRYINTASFIDYKYSLSIRHLNVLLSRNQIPEANEVMARVNDRDKQGNIAIVKSILATFSGNFDFALDQLKYASRYQQTFMYTTYDLSSHNFNIYGNLAITYRQQNNYLKVKNGWKARPIFLKNNIIGSYYKLLAVDNFRNIRDYLNDYSYPPGIYGMMYIIEDMNIDILAKKLDKYTKTVDKRKRSKKYYDLSLAYGYLHRRDIANTEKLLGKTYPDKLTNPKDEKMYLSVYYNAMSELAKLKKDKKLYRNSVIQIYCNIPQMVALKGQRMVFRYEGIAIADSLKKSVFYKGKRKRIAQTIKKRLDKEVHRWGIDIDNSSDDAPLIEITLRENKDAETNNTTNGIIVKNSTPYNFSVKISYKDKTIIEQRIVVEDASILNRRYLDKLFNTVFGFNEYYDDK